MPPTKKSPESERSEVAGMSSTQERTSKTSRPAAERSSDSRKKKEQSSLLSMPTIGDLEETEPKQVSVSFTRDLEWR